MRRKRTELEPGGGGHVVALAAGGCPPPPLSCCLYVAIGGVHCSSKILKATLKVLYQFEYHRSMDASQDFSGSAAAPEAKINPYWKAVELVGSVFMPKPAMGNPPGFNPRRR
jgi:hypothetical protein